MKSVAVIVLNNFVNDSRVLKEAISLVRAGYFINVVALHEGNLNEYEEKNEVAVHRLKLKSRNWSKNKIIQQLKYIEFFIRVISKYKSYDIFHCNDIEALPIGVVNKLFFNRKTKIVYDAHEHETERNGAKGINKYFIKMLEKLLIRFADKVITVSHSIAKDYVRLYRITEPSLVFNCPYLTEFYTSNKLRSNLDIPEDQIVFLYQGGLSRGRGIEVILETFSKIEDKRYAVIFMGYGILENEIKSYCKDNVNIYYHSAVPPIELLNYTAGADYGLSIIENVCLSYDYCLPNKLFEYIMAEVPVVVSNLFEMRSLVYKSGIGTICKTNTPYDLEKAIIEISNMDRNKLRSNCNSLKKEYNWENQEKVLLKEYSTL